jgi:hypothetical protein
VDFAAEQVVDVEAEVRVFLVGGVFADGLGCVFGDFDELEEHTQHCILDGLAKRPTNIKPIKNHLLAGNKLLKERRRPNIRTPLKQRLHPLNKHPPDRRSRIDLLIPLNLLLDLDIRQHLLAQQHLHISLKVLELGQRPLNQKLNVEEGRIEVHMGGVAETLKVWDVVEEVDVLLALFDFWEFDFGFVGDLREFLF